MPDFNQDQAHRSGLHIFTAKNSQPMVERQRPRKRRHRRQQQKPWWNQDVNQIPNLLERRSGFGAVALLDDNNNNNNTTADPGSGGGSVDSTTRIVLVGGFEAIWATKSVIIMSTITKSLFSVSSAAAKCEWREGPSLQEPRRDLAATVCGPYLYAIGGWTGSVTTYDTMERILLIDLFQHSINHQRASWTTLTARLSEPRSFHCAVTVPGDRFILVLGGFNEYCVSLSSVDIVDTLMPSDSTTTTITRDGDPITTRALVVQAVTTVSVRPGPNMQVPRYKFAAAVLDNKVWLVGGTGKTPNLTSVEYLQLPRHAMNHDNNCRNGSGSSVSSSSWVASLQSSSWQLPNDLNLGAPRLDHYIAVLPDHGCLVVAGGQDHHYYKNLLSVEVVDVRRQVVWELPPMTDSTRSVFSILHIPNHNQLGVLAGRGLDRITQNYVESLSFVDISSWRRLKQQLILMRFKEKQEQQEEPSIMPQHSSTPEVQRLYNTLLYFNLLQRPGFAKSKAGKKCQ